MTAGDDRRPTSARAEIPGQARRYSTTALDRAIGLLLLTIYVVAIVGLASLVTWVVIKIFPTERKPKKPKPEEPSSEAGGSAGAESGRLYRRAKRGTT